MFALEQHRAVPAEEITVLSEACWRQLRLGQSSGISINQGALRWAERGFTNEYVYFQVGDLPFFKVMRPGRSRAVEARDMRHSTETVG